MRSHATKCCVAKIPFEDLHPYYQLLHKHIHFPRERSGVSPPHGEYVFSSACTVPHITSHKGNKQVSKYKMCETQVIAETLKCSMSVFV